ncbi:MAG: hypothetical protein WDM94_15235 [Bauldia sp.]
MPRLAAFAFAFPLAVAAPLTAHAGMCVVDGETLEIRDHLIPTDNAYFVADQTGATLDWVISNEPLIDHEQSYRKYGLPRLVGIGEIEFHGFVGAVPMFKDSGDPEVPDVVYLLTNPRQCEVQPYAKAP